MTRDTPTDPEFCNPAFWERRYSESGNYEDAIQRLGADWKKVNELQKKVINKFVNGKVFDAACGTGRVSEMLENATDYVGMDITPMFIEEAKRRYPDKKFILGDIMETGFEDKSFDWGIAIGIADSIYWLAMEKELSRICKKVLILRCEQPNKYEII